MKRGAGSGRKCLYIDKTMRRPCQNLAASCPHPEHRAGRKLHGGIATDHSAAAVSAALLMDRPKLENSGTARTLPADVMRDLVKAVQNDTTLEQPQIEKDYWLHAALHRLSVRGIGAGWQVKLPKRRLRRPKTLECDLVFAGGTSLVSQWGLSRRHSEDIDLLLVDNRRTMNRAGLNYGARCAALVVADAIVERDDPDWVLSTLSPHPLQVQAYARRNGVDKYAKVDVNETAAELAQYEMRPVMSIMGRYATSEMLTEFPELGGFSLPALDFAVTIGNKMRATVENAESGRIDKLTQRARDLYDMASVVSDDEARDVILDHLNVCAVNAETRSDEIGKRAAAVLRFPDCETLKADTPESEAVRAGYEIVVENLVWQPDEAPSFGEAVDLLRGLRPDL